MGGFPDGEQGPRGPKMAHGRDGAELIPQTPVNHATGGPIPQLWQAHGSTPPGWMVRGDDHLIHLFRQGLRSTSTNSVIRPDAVIDINDNGQPTPAPSASACGTSTNRLLRQRILLYVSRDRSSAVNEPSPGAKRRRPLLRTIYLD